MGGGYGQIQVIGYVNIVWGHTLGMLISGGCRFGDRYGYMGDVHIMGRVGEFWDKHWIC